jgi:hypothetical protein
MLIGDKALPRTSWHEGGHTLAAKCLSLRVNYVELGDGTGSTLGATNHRRPADFRDELLILVGGAIGEELGTFGSAASIFGTHPGCRGDRTRFVEANRRRLDVADVIARCRRLIRPHVALLKCLASNLVELKRLDAVEVDRLVESYELNFKRSIKLCD